VVEKPIETVHPIDAVVSNFVDAARSAFSESLVSAVLYGSAAEGKLRKTSDVNLVLVVREFDRDAADRLREPLRLARAAARVTVMFLLESEIDAAVGAFAVKFDDILHRRRVVFGSDPFAGRSVPRAAAIARLNQVLLNLGIRLREAYVSRALREEQLALVVADAAGPLRAAAAALLELEGTRAAAPKQALEEVAQSLGGERRREALANVSRAREEGRLEPGVAGTTLFALVDLAREMRARLSRLAP
jgi:predicted nucleotidyltransferase